MEKRGIIELTNNSFLLNSYGKYKPNLTFLSDDKELIESLPWEKLSIENLNLEEGNIKIIYGEFFVSKKGTKCFRLATEKSPKNPHMLLRDSWGGAFSETRGYNLLGKDDALYEKRASSNGGGSGYDYAIFKVGWRNHMSEDDI